MSTTRLIAALRQRAEQAEADLLRVQERAQEAERRAELAEKAARDSYSFARTILRARS